MRSLAAVKLALCILVAGGCATKLQEAPPQEEVLEEALPETTEIRPEWAAPAEDTGQVDDAWLATFNDPQLDSLVAEALDLQNPNLRILAAQVDRAQASARLAGSALEPTVALGADLSGTAGPDSLEQTSGGAGIGISWELDVWGRVQAGVNAADENLRATVADFEFARQSLVANVAISWYLATELRLQAGLAQEVADLLAETVALVETKQRVGQVGMQDVFLARADLASAEDALQQAISGQQQARRALEILLGRYPAGEIETATELVPVPPAITSGLPADLLERRPDIIAADRRVAAAFFLTEEARLAKLPSFSLTAGVGGSSDLDGLIGDLSAGLVAPLYTGGALEAQLDIATADQDAAIAAYGATVLLALEQVEAGLTDEALLERREAFLSQSVDYNKQAYDLAQKQYDVGQIDLLNVLQMQSRWVGARTGLLRVKNARLAERINLHLALGGSFE
ncbi:MAG: efflux transporter outer membrane subunit [Gammaproteobacteria bacterium]|jgi:NodT family efflux transporter outer membrane factor (OMF) lipoprotein|nr:efflux transporter outer membrane subunit [Gammaproteobacteria bacterium]